MASLLIIVGGTIAGPIVGTELVKKRHSSNSTATSTSLHASSTPTATQAPTTATGTTVETATPEEIGIGSTFNASFTYYGSSDNPGAPTCNTLGTSCGFYTDPGYASAVSQNLYGAVPGAGVGLACGTCWKLDASTDTIGNKLPNASSIIIMVNNLCQAAGNTLCGQHNLSSTNQFGAQIAFDLCADTQAPEVLFGSSDVALALGNATRVYCEEWQGTRVPSGSD
ncbi:hypothetical protein NKR23_g4742 [Pleurostoma richardsiae]|uniref:Expansin-like EG45 domain-containing protein n=1 Tax=Pleurostoma richardsiae TaxID=41990 RepID=A0AA38VFJ2_9PEZI|nr:hypothetical protein NKR23_g4742 [Pleurostoma richardsiae]